MRFRIIIFLLLGFNWLYAQNNILKVGIPGVLYIDDVNPKFNFHNLDEIPLLTYLSYERVINKKLGISIDYAHYWITYEDANKSLKKGEILWRNYHQLSTKFHYYFQKNTRFELDGGLGVSYRFFGLEHFFIEQGNSFEQIRGENIYNDLGINVSLNAKYWIVKQWGLGTNIGFTKPYSKTKNDHFWIDLYVSFRF